ncbi:MAG: FAD-dependent oxidoreductase [Myxococcota bacterium]
MSHEVIVVGAGLAGLTCGRLLGERAILLERGEQVGGVAGSVQRDGFTFDHTGHWLHLSQPWTRDLIAELFRPEELIEVQRRAAIVSRGIRTAYPFQANTYGRPTDVVAACVLGYFQARERKLQGNAPAPATFEDYIRDELGDGVAEHFMLPYNQKLWCTPPRELDAAWCRRFVPTPTPEEVVRGALSSDGAGHGIGYNASFLYPRVGGIGELSRRLAHSLHAAPRTHAAVAKIDWSAKSLVLGDGTTLAYEHLVSSMPLCDLVDRLAPLPAELREARTALRAVSVTYWDVGVRGVNGTDDAHWTYFPDDDVPFYRVGSPSSVLPTLAPAGHRSYYVEVAHLRGNPPPCDDAKVLAGLRRAGLVGTHEEPVLMVRNTLDVAYVIMDHAYGAARATLLAWLAAHNIASIGRYGAWTYDSMEGAMLQGRDAAWRIGASVAACA